MPEKVATNQNHRPAELGRVFGEIDAAKYTLRRKAAEDEVQNEKIRIAQEAEDVKRREELKKIEVAAAQEAKAMAHQERLAGQKQAEEAKAKADQQAAQRAEEERLMKQLRLETTQRQEQEKRRQQAEQLTQLRVQKGWTVVDIEKAIVDKILQRTRSVNAGYRDARLMLKKALLTGRGSEAPRARPEQLGALFEHAFNVPLTPQEVEVLVMRYKSDDGMIDLEALARRLIPKDFTRETWVEKRQNENDMNARNKRQELTQQKEAAFYIGTVPAAHQGSFCATVESAEQLIQLKLGQGVGADRKASKMAPAPGRETRQHRDLFKLFGNAMQISPALFRRALAGLNVPVDPSIEAQLFAKYSQGQNPADASSFLARMMPESFSGTSWVDKSQHRIEQKAHDVASLKHSHLPGNARKFHHLDQIPVRKNWPTKTQDVHQDLINKLSQLKPSKGNLHFLFRHFDREGKQHITAQDFLFGVKALNFDIPDAQVRQLFQGLDSNGDGLLDLREFQEGLEPTGGAALRTLHRAPGPDGQYDNARVLKSVDRGLAATPILDPTFSLGGQLAFPAAGLPFDKKHKPRPPLVQSNDTDTIKTQKAARLRKQRRLRLENLIAQQPPQAPKALTSRRRPQDPNNVINAPPVSHGGAFRCHTYRG